MARENVASASIVNCTSKVWSPANCVDILTIMKIITKIGLVIVLVAIFGGFWLYQATMPKNTEPELIPETSDSFSNSQFLQLRPKSLPPTVSLQEKQNKEQSNEEKAVEESDQVQKSSNVQEEQPAGQVSGAEDNVIIEDNGGTSITDIDEPGVVVSMTDVGFFPASISIEVGSTVTFVNDGQSLHWPASNVHPTHDLLSGFDSEKGISTGGAYAFTFTKKGEWSFHDHLNPDSTGTIVVE